MAPPSPPPLPPAFRRELRILCTFVLLGAVALAGFFMFPWQFFNSTFDNIVEGGIEALPFPQPLMLGHVGWRIGWLLLPALAILLQIWRERSRFLPTIAITLFIGFLLISASIGGTFLLNESLRVVIEKIKR